MPLGHAEIVQDLSNCLIEENFTTATGYHGKTFMGFDPSNTLWYRHSIDNHGLRLSLSGSMEDGAMVLTGSGPVLGDTRRLKVRTRIEELGDGTVRQMLEVSLDG